MRINTPPTLAGLQTHLRDFLDMMVFKLHQNSHKETPTRDQIPAIVAGIRREIEEFEEQITLEKDDPNSLVELADAANMAFLAFVALRNQGVKDARERFIDEYLDIDHENGKVFVKKGRPGSVYRVGDEILGTKNKDGYIYIRAQSRAGGSHANVSCPRSHLVWYGKHGKWPTGVLDHINRVRDDDRVSNLRDITCSENNLNTGKTRKYPPFVSTYKPTGRESGANYGKYVYQRRFKGMAYRYGYYNTPEEASTDGLRRFREEVGYSPTLDL